MSRTSAQQRRALNREVQRKSARSRNRAGLTETFGGALIVLGLFTRPVAFLLAGEMAVGYFRTHAPRGLWPLSNGGELAVIYCFFYLWLSSAGGGPWSVDTVFRRKS